MPKTLTAHERAKQWREKLGLSVDRLADVTGFSRSTIFDMESGFQRTTGKPVEPRAFQRYRLTCAAINSGAESFDWS